jgi:hypothetical protein
MACGNCHFRGFLVAPVLRQGDKTAVHQCPKCRDTRRYSDMVQMLCGYAPPSRGPAKFYSITARALMRPRVEQGPAKVLIFPALA